MAAPADAVVCAGRRCCCGVAGLIGGLGLAPPDYQQGDGFRIIYVHAPAAWLSLMVYIVMALSAAVGLIWRMNVAHAVAASCATIGASFTALALVDRHAVGPSDVGHLLGMGPAPDLGTAAAVSVSGLHGTAQCAFDDIARADRASAVLAIVGVINVPIIHYSVDLVELPAPGPERDEIRPAHHAGLDAGAAAADAGGVHAVFHRAAADRGARRKLLRRERNARWIAEVLGVARQWARRMLAQLPRTWAATRSTCGPATR